VSKDIGTLISLPETAEVAELSSMIYLVVVLHILVSFFLIGVVLLQQGKSADLAGAFGGQGSQTAFGPRGAANLLTRLTTYSAIFFMLTSLGLTILLARSSSDHSVLSGLKTGTTNGQSAPAKTATPPAPTTPAAPAQK
jgi:preprotein translocase subunit SecG